MSKLVKVLGVGGGGLVLLLAAAYTGVAWTASAGLERTAELHQVDIPVPWPLSSAEVEALRQERLGALAEAGVDAADPLEGIDLDALALERALARGEHLVTSRYVCVECHGKDFGGGTMVDDPMIGGFFGPNLTLGEGSVVRDYTMSDWDAIIRHGLRRDGKVAVMPSEDFVGMSDQELSDIVAYIQTHPPVDRTMPERSLGPLGQVLVSTGALVFSYDRIHDHAADHPELPPAAEPTVTFGRHLAGICTGCHGESLVGGPIPSGPPHWAPASNLTPHADGLEDWTYEQFARAMREGIGADGTALREPMDLMPQYANNMTEVELQALWAYLQSVPALPSPR